MKKGSKHTEEAKMKSSIAHKGQIAWNKGKKGYTNAGTFKKGHKLGMTGKHHLEETKQKMSIKRIGRYYGNGGGGFKKGHKPWCTGTKGLVKAWNKGKFISEEHKHKISQNKNRALKISLALKGKHHSEAAKRNMSLAAMGKHCMDKNPAWRGGISFEPYGIEFNDKLKEQIRYRDNYRCQECFRHQNELKCPLMIHHIDYNKNNNQESNLIPLCNSCHSQTNFKRENWINYFKNKLIEAETCQTQE